MPGGKADARPVVTEHELLIDFNSFGLQLVLPLPADGTAIEPVIRGDRLPDGLMLARETGVFILSGGRCHYPTIRTEVWPAEPPPDEGTVTPEDEERVVITLPPHAVLQVVAFEERSDHPIRLERGGRYVVHASVWGREAATELGDEPYFRGVEQWRIRIWPEAGSGERQD